MRFIRKKVKNSTYTLRSYTYICTWHDTYNSIYIYVYICILYTTWCIIIHECMVYIHNECTYIYMNTTKDMKTSLTQIYLISLRKVLFGKMQHQSANDFYYFTQLVGLLMNMLTYLNFITHVSHIFLIIWGFFYDFDNFHQKWRKFFSFQPQFEKFFIPEDQKKIENVRNYHRRYSLHDHW